MLGGWVPGRKRRKERDEEEAFGGKDKEKAWRGVAGER